MGERIAHRGPDDEVYYDDAELAFVFRRLSIIDVQNGKQPIWNENRTMFAAVNGEIYNHRELRDGLQHRHVFRTQSDSEVVLHLYEEAGPAALDRLVGEFAIAIWDRVAQRLFLARDRLGVKPLYYHHAGTRVVFGSELKSLLAYPHCPREFKWEQPRLLDSRVPTHVSEVEFLPAGHYAYYDVRSGLDLRRYWRVEDFIAPRGASGQRPEEYVERYAELFGDSVRKHLMSDVPIGSFLSGGLDSSMVVAAAAQSNRDIECFTVLERSTYKCGDAPTAERLCMDLGLSFHPVVFDYRSFLSEIDFSLQTLEFLIGLIEIPRFRLEWLVKHELHRYAKTTAPSLKVMLLGQGADEFGGGYSNQLFPGNARTDWEDFLNRGTRQSLRAEVAECRGIPPDILPLLTTAYVDAGHEQRWTDFQVNMVVAATTLQSYNLWHEDRTSASQGIEARIPFLDHRLVELLVGIPPELHPQLFWDKWLIRQAARRWLPADMVSRRKVGFVEGHDRLSADAIYREIIRRAYPEFREKYLCSSDAMFSERELSAAIVGAASAGSSRESMNLALDCMAVAIFRENCRSPGRRVAQDCRPPSALRAAHRTADVIWHDDGLID